MLVVSGCRIGQQDVLPSLCLDRGDSCPKTWVAEYQDLVLGKDWWQVDRDGDVAIYTGEMVHHTRLRIREVSMGVQRQGLTRGRDPHPWRHMQATIAVAHFLSA
jgi:hypothetical protein